MDKWIAVDDRLPQVKMPNFLGSPELAQASSRVEVCHNREPQSLRTAVYCESTKGSAYWSEFQNGDEIEVTHWAELSPDGILEI